MLKQNNGKNSDPRKRHAAPVLTLSLPCFTDALMLKGFLRVITVLVSVPKWGLRAQVCASNTFVIIVQSQQADCNHVQLSIPPILPLLPQTEVCSGSCV